MISQKEQGRSFEDVNPCIAFSCFQWGFVAQRILIHRPVCRLMLMSSLRCLKGIKDIPKTQGKLAI